MTTNAFEGSCHCGALAFTYRTSLQPQDWPIRACQCSFCRAHASRSTSDPKGSVAFRENIPGSLAHYRFGQRTADFLLCRSCGVYLAATMISPVGHFAVINVNALKPIPVGLAEPSAHNFDKESPQDRIARREQRWTPVTVS